MSDRLVRSISTAQATDRIGMVHAIGGMVQQLITAITLAATVFYFSPWLLVLLVAAVVPVFVGESHYAFLGYSLGLRQTPLRRQLDYLRQLGASKESAKELKLFGLAPLVSERYTQLSDELYVQNLALSRRRRHAAGLAQESAVMIATVEPDSPAARAGLAAGDIILALDGTTVTGADDLIRNLAGDKIARRVEIEALRNGSRIVVSLVPDERPHRS